VLYSLTIYFEKNCVVCAVSAEPGIFLFLFKFEKIRVPCWAQTEAKKAVKHRARAQRSQMAALGLN